MKILITGACAVSARSVLRSLKMSPIFKDSEFIGWDQGTILYGLYSGDFNRIYKVPGVKDEHYAEIVRNILQQEKPDAAIIVPEIEVLYWAEHDFEIPYIVPPKEFCKLVISKQRLFDALADTSLVPKHLDVSATDLLKDDFINPLGFPVWIRDASDATASGKGSYKALGYDDLRAWVKINIGIQNFQLSEFLPGGNFGSFCLFRNGKLIKHCEAERIEYIMSKVAVSGITGNTSKGRLLNNGKIKNVSLEAIDRICKQTGEIMNGLVVVDLKGDKDNNPIITEINIRHVAYSSIFASAGINISEAQLLLALGRDKDIEPTVEKKFPTNNLLLRDVDGEPIYMENPPRMSIGEYFPKK